MPDALLILCSCPDDETAARLAHHLVEERLAACVHCLPGGTSTYRWDDRVTQSSEIQLLIKTVAKNYPAVEARIVALHPYSLPEIIALPIERGLPAYLAWIDAETSR